LVNYLKKAQVSIEFIIIIAVFLLVFYSMILPSINFAENVITDVYGIVQTKNNVSELASNLENLSNSAGYGTRQIFFYLPDNAYIVGCDSTTSPKKIISKINVSPENSVSNFCNDEGVCDINVFVYTNLDLDCNSLGIGFRGNLNIKKENGVIEFYD
jgi:hypothetical protein